MILRLQLLILFCSLTILNACKQEDSKTIIGKWQSDNDWFEYKADSTYSSGKFGMKMVDGFKYSIDGKTKELNMYTDQKDRTFYLKYKFRTNDTLAVRNVMSSDTSWVIFYRTKDVK